ncbi:ribosome hibernation-promoting factor, HPF/YfiA family [Microvirga puerhi]|uniref:Ribosome hibernation promoting factor n=1 Tax=Microvirga puerhi TaxID=2876078 RepID=A0ABS7VNM3_9HYPH|nr:ribosome-associated translation inhibitor RaiA [Microvirga puerhi]MBZ6077126.1 ribosome-associated translation inhibitor RaiA [Microvirga puerhi]
MTLRVSGKNLDIGEALRSQVQARMATALTKYFDGSYKGHVTVTRDGGGFRTDCVVHLPTGMTLEASGAAIDAYASFDQTAERIEKRLRRYTRRLKEHPTRNGRDMTVEAPYAVFESPTDETVQEEAYHPVVIAETTKPLHRFSVSDAVMQLDLTGVPALVFIHASTGRVNVVYRRSDGAIGWVDPPHGQS